VVADSRPQSAVVVNLALAVADSPLQSVVVVNLPQSAAVVSQMPD
jgi:hypothetical protein